MGINSVKLKIRQIFIFLILGTSSASNDTISDITINEINTGVNVPFLRLDYLKNSNVESGYTSESDVPGSIPPLLDAVDFGHQPEATYRQDPSSRVRNANSAFDSIPSRIEMRDLEGSSSRGSMTSLNRRTRDSHLETGFSQSVTNIKKQR